MIGFLISTIIFSLLIGITVTLIFYFIKKYMLKRQTTFRKNIWIGVIVTFICFVLCMVLINGMDKINV